ncbi:DUF2249 domain-containing protein [Actomonas aquatica]|uniref:DUF2249 domain-containing protein n=1 Tax=Actomonas aquatica TaxID=2866162 RepID=A0ABZ1C562_9BACT|nr:DUF2249 domain-containing protein [Opitutus sp. WL0086]WRQ86537.1 DUF2249 domain-containing protein [Opitutus sp. WL0086]
MNPSLESSTDTRFDVRPIPCRIKHGMIFERWHNLAVGEHFTLVNDHDPVPLYYQFAAEFPHAFNWEYEERGPEQFAVRITRLAPTPRPATPVTAPAAAPTGSACGGVTLVDARGLEPPEPMLRILAALEALPPGDTLQAFTDRQPIHLLPELGSRGCTHEGQAEADGSWRTSITKPRA